MEEIFKKIEGRDWDWFGYKPTKVECFEKGLANMPVVAIYTKHMEASYGSTPAPYVFSLADLLANRSWCKAVWVTTVNTRCCDGWQEKSKKAFQILQQQGEKECISYIKETMV